MLIWQTGSMYLIWKTLPQLIRVLFINVSKCISHIMSCVYLHLLHILIIHSIDEYQTLNKSMPSIIFNMLQSCMITSTYEIWNMVKSRCTPELITMNMYSSMNLIVWVINNSKSSTYNEHVHQYGHTQSY